MYNDYIQARNKHRPRMTFPVGSVEALEPTHYQRVTSRGARMEIDFWKNILMPLKSGLVSEVIYKLIYLIFK